MLNSSQSAGDRPNASHSAFRGREAGRIDCRGDDLGQFGSELGVDPMKSEDWHRFGVWLNTVETDYMWTLDQLVEMYERTNPKIEWWVENDRK